MSFDIEYKQDDADTAGAILSDNNGPLDLTGKTVTFVIKDTDVYVDQEAARYEIPCILGGYYQNSYYSAARGGVTIPFIPTEVSKPTQQAGIFKGEFVITWAQNNFTYTRRCPSGNNTHTIMIWEKL